MKVAFVHQPWSIVRPGQTGADSVVLWTDEVARKLAQRGCEVTCYSRAGDGLPGSETVAGVEHRRLKSPVDRYVKFALSRLDRWGLRNRRRPGFASPLAYRQFAGRLARDLRERPPDIVHVHNMSQFVPILRRALPETKIALQMHCDWLSWLSRKSLTGRLSMVNLLIGPSDYLAGTIRARFPQFTHQIRRVWNGANEALFANPPVGGRATKRVLYVGRVSPEKGIHTLLDAFAELNGSVELQIVGPERIVAYEMTVPCSQDPRITSLEAWFRTGYANHLKRQIERQRAGRVQWIDREVPHTELPGYYRGADVFVFPSIWDEAFGMPLAEAMLAGLPCIATRAGAFPEIVSDGETGLLVERADAKGLAKAIARLCGDEQLRRRMGAAGRERARRLFTWDCVADALLEEYRRVSG